MNCFLNNTLVKLRNQSLYQKFNKGFHALLMSNAEKVTLVVHASLEISNINMQLPTFTS